MWSNTLSKILHVKKPFQALLGESCHYCGDESTGLFGFLGGTSPWLALASVLQEFIWPFLGITLRTLGRADTWNWPIAVASALPGAADQD